MKVPSRLSATGGRGDSSVYAASSVNAVLLHMSHAWGLGSCRLGIQQANTSRALDVRCSLCMGQMDYLHPAWRGTSPQTMAWLIGCISAVEMYDMPVGDT